jgi:hypothetical protein
VWIRIFARKSTNSSWRVIHLSLPYPTTTTTTTTAYCSTHHTPTDCTSASPHPVPIPVHLISRNSLLIRIMSQPRLIISAGPSWESLAPIAVNTTTYVPISTPSFEGRVVVRIVDFLGPAGDEGEPQPPQGFTHRDLDSVSWTIVVQGRFKEDLNADELVRYPPPLPPSLSRWLTDERGRCGVILGSIVLGISYPWD